VQLTLVFTVFMFQMPSIDMLILRMFALPFVVLWWWEPSSSWSYGSWIYNFAISSYHH